MIDTVVVSFLYPELKPYLAEYFDSLMDQNDQAYDLLFFNDGFLELEKELKPLRDKGLTIQIVGLTGTPTEIRFQALKYLLTTTYSNILFQDADDLMTLDRIAVCKKFLSDFPLVVCDLDLINQQSKLIKEKVWSDRLEDSFEFDHQFIQNWNIVGFGNIALRRELIDVGIQDFKKSVRVADWFFFYQILYLSKAKGIFTNQARILYRQHDRNMVGLGSISEESIEKAFETKKEQYQALLKIGIDSSRMMNLLNDQELLWSKNHAIKNVDYYPFWWEETTFIK